MKPAFESKSAARRILACAAVALVAAVPAAWAQNSQRPDEGTGAPILPPPDTSAQGTDGMSNGNTAAPPPATRMQEPRGTGTHGRPPVRTKPGGPSAGYGRSPGATGSGGGGAGGTGSAGSSGY